MIIYQALNRLSTRFERTCFCKINQNELKVDQNLEAQNIAGTQNLPEKT